MLKQRGRVIGTGSLDVRDQVGNSDLGDDQVKTLCFQYDFDDLAGAQGAVTLTSRSDVAQTIPDNAVIVRSYVEGITSPTSGGSATIKVGITGDDDCFIAATAYDNGEYDIATVTEFTAGIPIKTTAAVAVLATIAVADLTAGKFNVWIDYYEGS